MPSESTAISTLAPIGLNEVSRQLGVDPFETVRLLVATGQDLSGHLAFKSDVVDMLREQGGVQESWWPNAAAMGSKERVGAAVKAMLDRGYLGDTTTRMDNIWRGLPFEDQSLLQQALTVLAEAQIVRCVGTPMGLQVAIDGKEKAMAEQIASGQASTPALDALYED